VSDLAFVAIGKAPALGARARAARGDRIDVDRGDAIAALQQAQGFDAAAGADVERVDRAVGEEALHQRIATPRIGVDLHRPAVGEQAQRRGASGRARSADGSEQRSGDNLRSGLDPWTLGPSNPLGHAPPSSGSIENLAAPATSGCTRMVVGSISP
jgi:hypothetical protein